MRPFLDLVPGECFTLAADWEASGPRPFVKVDGQHAAFAAGPHGQSYRVPVALTAATIWEPPHAALLRTWFGGAPR